MKKGEHKTSTCTNGRKCTLDWGHSSPCKGQRMANPAGSKEDQMRDFWQEAFDQALEAGADPMLASSLADEVVADCLAWDKRHGGPYDRGAADSWYSRGRNPHYYMGKSYQSDRVAESKMTAEEIAAYNAGYEDNEASGSHKEWDR